MLVTGIFSFSSSVSYAFFFKVIKSPDCVVKSSLFTKHQNLFIVYLFKAFAIDKINENEKFMIVLGRVENIACNQHFLHFLQFFEGFFLKAIKTEGFVVKRYILVLFCHKARKGFSGRANFINSYSLSIYKISE